MSDTNDTIDQGENDKLVINFLREIEHVCRKHSLFIEQINSSEDVIISKLMYDAKIKWIDKAISVIKDEILKKEHLKNEKELEERRMAVNGVLQDEKN